MIPLALGLIGKVAAAAVLPRVVKAVCDLVRGAENHRDSARERCTGETSIRNNPVTGVDPSGLDPANWSTGMTRAMQYKDEIICSAKRYGVPREVIAAALAHEMEWAGIQGPKSVVAGMIKNPWSVSTGIAQIKPSTAKQIDIESGLTPLKTAEGYQAILQYPRTQIDYLTRNLLLNLNSVEKKMPKTNCDGMPADAKKNLKWFIVVDAHNNRSQLQSWKWGAGYDGQVWKDLQDAYEGFGKR